MDVRRFIAVGLLAGSSAVAAGCRVDPYAEVREREWRRLENEIYSLEGVVEDLEGQLDSCRRENDALRRRGATESGDAGGERLPAPYRTPAAGGDLPDNLEDLRPPRTDLGTEAPPPPVDHGSQLRKRPVSLAGLNRSQANGASRKQRGSRNDGLRVADAAPRLFPPTNTIEEIDWPQDDARDRVPEATAGEKLTPANPSSKAGDSKCSPAVSIRLLPRLTGGNDIDHRFGDEGIMAVVDARDDDGALVADPGAMTLTLYDPLASGDGGIVAQWDFTAAEVAKRFRDGFMGSGVHFELPWPNRPPRRPALRLEVRCESATGKTLVASHKFSVDLCGPAQSVSETAKASARASAAADASAPAWKPMR